MPSRTSPNLSATLSFFHVVIAPQQVLGERRWLSSDAAMWYSVPAILIVDEMFMSQGIFCPVSCFRTRLGRTTYPAICLNAVPFRARNGPIELLGHARRHVDLVGPRVQRRKVPDPAGDRVLYPEAVESNTPAAANRGIDLQPIAAGNQIMNRRPV